MLLVPGIASKYYARSTMASFWRHNWSNGLWAVLPFGYTEGMPISLRHLIPLLFMSAVLVTGAMGIVSRPFAWMSGGILGAYAMMNLAASLHVARTEKSFTRLVTMPLVFATLHVSYGLGSLWGLLRLMGLPQFWEKLGWSGTGRPSTVES